MGALGPPKSSGWGKVAWAETTVMPSQMQPESAQISLSLSIFILGFLLLSR